MTRPPLSLLMSMAIRSDHALGTPGYYDSLPYRPEGLPSHDQILEATLRSMWQLWEEASGNGFYSPEREQTYAALVPPEIVDRLFPPD